MKNELRFRDGRIRLLQVSDPQDLKNVRPAMVQMLNKAYDTLSPDLVVFTGDNILGNHLLDARIGTRQVGEGREDTLEAMRFALSKILMPVNRRRIPFAMIYGNHDDMNCIAKEEQADIYRQYPMSMEMNRDNPDVDCDTYEIKLLPENGGAGFRLYMIDCAWQDKTGERRCHTEITDATKKWLEDRVRENKGIPAILFLHIPLPEQEMLTQECGETDKGAVRFPDGTFRRLRSGCEGVLNEPVSYLENSNGLFELIKESGDIKAVVTGHDHGNCFTGKAEGVEFIQTGAASFRCYGSRESRGVRVIDIYEDGRYETRFYTYFDLCGVSPYTLAANFINADELEKIKFWTLGTAAFLSVSGLAAYRINKYLKKKK